MSCTSKRWQIMRILAAALLFALLPQDADVEALVARLGDDDIAVRDDASAKLRALPIESLPAMKAALRRADGDARARLQEITVDLERLDFERRHDAEQRARFLGTTNANEGATMTCAPKLRDDGIVLTTTLTPAAGLEFVWTVKEVVDEKGESVKVERCAVCSPRLVLACTKEPVRARVTGTRRWFSSYDVVFENPRSGDLKRIGGYTIEIAWPQIVITSNGPVASHVLTRTATEFAYDLRRQPEEMWVFGSSRCGIGRIVKGGSKEPPAGWCSCIKGPTPWAAPAVPTSTRHVIGSSGADQFAVSQVARIRFTFRKPVDEPFEAETVLVKP